MFDTLTGKLGEVFESLKRRGVLKEQDVVEALREIRVALLEADVALPVVKSFIDAVRAKATGSAVLRSVTPGQMVVKVVHDHLVEMLGAESQGIDLMAPAPVGILVVGLQGSGKTTTTAKLGKRLTGSERKKVLMASLDIHRPAAQEQLKVLGEQVAVATLPIVAGQTPVQIARRAMEAGRLGGYDVVLLDTAGRLHVDEGLMGEAAQVKAAVNPHETILVADAMTGQDAVNVAKSFNDRLGLTGIILTRVDGDARGGAALSMRAVTGKPIKLIGTGEKLDALEPFHPDRIAGRILGMGDIVSLVEKVRAEVDEEDAEAMARKMRKGQLDLNDMAKQLRQMRRMGGLQGVMSMLPGLGKMQQQVAKANINEDLLKRQEAIIMSMTPGERRNPNVIHASRKQRIATGSGTSVQEVNKLLKQFLTMSKMMKKMGRMDPKALARSMPGIPGMPRF
ncbi:MAG: signal recognition particle protein [Alphaproteobacteria bacterium]